MLSLPPKPQGARLPKYGPFGPYPKTPLRWTETKKLPGWLQRHRPPLVDPQQYVRWSKPVWLWFEGRDGLFLASGSFLVVDQGYWDATWRERGALYLYLATHAWIQLAGAAALSLCPRGELETLCEVHEPGHWHVEGAQWTGISARPDCYVAPRGLPWRHGVGSLVEIYGEGRSRRTAALKKIQREAHAYLRAHQSPEAARRTLLEHLWISENKPCEVVVREPGWWNTSMRGVFEQEAPAVWGQVELVPLENWQIYDVDPKTGDWIPR